MESRVSSKFTCNIHRPFTPEKEVKQKENTVGKIAQRQQSGKFMHTQIQILAKFYSIMKCFVIEKIGIF